MAFRPLYIYPVTRLCGQVVALLTAILWSRVWFPAGSYVGDMFHPSPHSLTPLPVSVAQDYSTEDA